MICETHLEAQSSRESFVVRISYNPQLGVVTRWVFHFEAPSSEFFAEVLGFPYPCQKVMRYPLRPDAADKMG